jgi:tetratricopeptide (TPR) repeat protein
MDKNMRNRKQCRQAIVILLTAICLSWICCGCQMVRSHPPPTQALLDRVLSGESLLGDRAARLSLPEDDIFGITTDMREFLNMHVLSTESNYFKLERLTEAMMDESLGWKIDSFKTYTAADTFYHRQGNCLSYAIMMIVLGRELCLELYFNEVHIPPVWDMQTEHTVVLLRHVNVLAEVDARRIILDPDLEEYDSSYPQFRIADIAAEAYYYNNRGSDYLNANNMEQAFLYFRKALTLQPEQAFLWVNLGVLYLRYGHYQEAEAAFLHALELDSSDITAISNIQFLYVKQGNTKLANYYRQEAERSRMNNPYYRYFLAKQLLDDNQPDLALKHIKWSIRKYGREHRFHFLAAKVYARLGKPDDAKKSLERAAKLTEDEENLLLYQSKIARLREISK